jgi:hypothetical protein
MLDSVHGWVPRPPDEYLSGGYGSRPPNLKAPEIAASVNPRRLRDTHPLGRCFLLA